MVRGVLLPGAPDRASVFDIGFYRMTRSKLEDKLEAKPL